MNFLYMLEARGDGVFLLCKKTLIRSRFLSLTPNIIPTFVSNIHISQSEMPRTDDFSRLTSGMTAKVVSTVHPLTLPKMDRFLKLIGLLTCLMLMGYGLYWLIQHFPKYVEPTLQGLGVVALLVLVVRLYLGRDWLTKTGKEFVIGSDLIQATEHLLNDLPKPKNETTTKV